VFPKALLPVSDCFATRYLFPPPSPSAYALFPAVAEKFFKVRDAAPTVDENGVRTLIVEDLSE
jgi:hypothetical protein